MREEWKPIVGYEGLYEVSNMGRVRSLDHVDRLGRVIKGRLRKEQKSSKGYRQVCLSKRAAQDRINPSLSGKRVYR